MNSLFNNNAVKKFRIMRYYYKLILNGSKKLDYRLADYTPKEGIIRFIEWKMGEKYRTGRLHSTRLMSTECNQYDDFNLKEKELLQEFYTISELKKHGVLILGI